MLLSRQATVRLAVLVLAATTFGRADALAPAAAQAVELHGERDVFVTSGIVIVWGVLRAPAGEDAQVVIRIAGARGTYALVRVDAVDPFTRARHPVGPAAPVTEIVDVRSPRSTFGDFPRREIHLYRTTEDWRADAPALTIYYLGVPDTAPEFTSESALLSYLASAVTKARGGP